MPSARHRGLAARAQAAFRWATRVRFFRFGLVGASGVAVNLAVLHLCHTLLFAGVASELLRLNASLAVAIFVATLNNFTWNRSWTWRDRRSYVRTRITLQFAQYALACWLGIALQVVLTNLLAVHFHYLVANATAIVLASLTNFLVNDFWTFGRMRPRAQRRTPEDESAAGVKP